MMRQPTEQEEKISGVKKTVNVAKSKELIVDYQRRGDQLKPIAINALEVDKVNSFKLLVLTSQKTYLGRPHRAVVRSPKPLDLTKLANNMFITV